MDNGLIISIVATALGIVVLVFRNPLGDKAEKNFGHLNFGMPPGYTKASVALLGLVLALFGIIGAMTLLLQSI